MTPSTELFVLVGGWPGAGKSTLARPLAAELGLAFLAKDEIKEVLMTALGIPTTIAESRRLGGAAVRVLLRVAAGCPGAVLDSTWFAYSRPLVEALPGRVVEIRCAVPVDVARSRYRARSAQRHAGHLDDQRTDAELWGTEHEPLGVGPVLTVDTSRPLDVATVARRVRELADSPGE